MENPLSAREFLKRFHLPQLVRIAGLQEEEVATGKKQAFTSCFISNTEHAGSLKSQTISSESSSTGSFARTLYASDSKTATELNPAHELSREWTFRRPVVRQETQGNSSQSSDLRHSQNTNKIGQQLSSRSPSNVDLLLERRATELGVRLPRACLARPSTGRAAPILQPSTISYSDDSKKSPPKDKQTSEQWGLKHSTRLTPVSKRPMLSKLELNQPFLLYKAYKKLELCAYLLDPKNQLNERSGDPIYFPHDYPGWFSMLKPSVDDTFGSEDFLPQLETKPLETVDQICRSRAEVFLTRDEIIGYQLPSELTHLTKLHNNQILPLPLAINLESSNNSKWYKSKASTDDAPMGCNRKQQSRRKRASGDASICGLKQIVIKSGQVLKICGIYEDILPLIEGNRQPGAKPDSQSYRRLQETLRTSNQTDSIALEQHYQMAQQTAMYKRHQYQHPAQHQPSYSNRLNKEQLISGGQQYAVTGAPIYSDSYKGLGGWPGSSKAFKEPPVAAQLRPGGSTVAPVAAGSGRSNQQPLYCQQNQQQLPKSGQRYARCLLVSERAVDTLTGCLSRGLEPAEQQYQQQQQQQKQHQKQLACEQSSGEIEVLIPIEQRGRFYLCASKQSLARELSSATRASHMRQPPTSACQIFRLSQLVHLLNLSPIEKQQPTEQLHHRLSLHLHLVAGPRPANYSPSMFGHSSTMDSYFRREANIAGHSINCFYNKNYSAPVNSSTASLAQKGEACSCGQRLLTGPASSLAGDDTYIYGSFSAVLRLESLIRRDVLLACTIKKEPLAHLNLSEVSEDIAMTDLASTGLLASREKNHSRHLGTARKSASLSKSSFGRLRACRSLISLNGGRRKKRPKIPEALMMDRHNLLSFGGCDVASTEGGANNAGSLNSSKQVGSGIVLLELDCNEPQLELVRTFVDSSLPASSIPDLVLNRMEFCHRNSVKWERQLKLSYATLAHDFESCSGQLELSRRLMRERSSTCSQLASGAVKGYRQATMGGSRTMPVADNSSSSSSSSSSRSSSGVSSVECVGGLNPRVSESSVAGGVGVGAGLRLASLSSLDSQRSCFDGDSASPPTSHHNHPRRHLPHPPPPAPLTKAPMSNRLLRFVHRLLPASSQSVASGQASTYASAPMDPSDADGRRMCSGSEVQTLMNAQRVYRKMLAVEHDAASQRQHVRRHRQNNLTPSPQQQHNEAHDETTSSHLYESLDRLHFGRLTKTQAPRESCLSMRGRSLDYLGGMSEHEEVEQLEEEEVSDANEEEEEEADWWCRQRQHDASSTGELGSRSARLRSSASELDQLEPVSIEQEEVTHSSDEGERHQHSFSSSEPEVETDRSYSDSEGLTQAGGVTSRNRKNDQLGLDNNECPYVNLIDVDGRQARALSRQLLASCTGSRAERKLVRMRARQPASADSRDWLTSSPAYLRHRMASSTNDQARQWEAIRAPIKAPEQLALAAD